MAENKIDYNSYQEELVRLRRYFHQFPEVSTQEKDTSEYIKAYLQELKIPVQRADRYGLTAVIYAGSERIDSVRTTAVRAEMDAVPVREETDFSWKSKREGVMHACGHDGILAVALVLAKICAEHKELLKTNVKFIFQPEEENGQGTGLMLGAGVMETPKVDDFVMFHFVNDAPEGMELNPQSASAAIGSLSIRIIGKPTHWGNYARGIDSIAIAGQMQEEIRKLNQNYGSSSPYLIGIGTIHGGTAKNVVAAETIMEGTIRASRLKDYEDLKKLIEERADILAKETGAVIETEITDPPIPPIVNNKELLEKGFEAGKKVFGEESRLVKTEYLSGDSAAWYFDKARGIFFVFTSEGEEGCYPLHSGKFDFGEDILWKALKVLHIFLTNS